MKIVYRLLLLTLLLSSSLPTVLAREALYFHQLSELLMETRLPHRTCRRKSAANRPAFAQNRPVAHSWGRRGVL